MENNYIFNFNEIRKLESGENNHQKASLYDSDKKIDWEILYGDNLNANSIVDSSFALEIASEFFDVNAVAIVKNSTPIAVALADNLENAWDKAFDSDPISPFNSTVALTKKVDDSMAKKLALIPLNIVIAPDFSSNAVVLLQSKKIKMIKVNTPYQNILNLIDNDIKTTLFGTIIQEKDKKDLDVSTFKVATKKKPEQKEVEDMIFAFKIAKHIKSYSAVVAKDLRTIGISSNQTTTSMALEVALNKVCDSIKGSVVAFDDKLTTIDNIHIAAQNRISGIIQSAGAINDDEIIKTADKLEISMITTGITHIKN